MLGLEPWKRLATGLSNGKVIVFSAPNGRILWESEKLDSDVYSIGWSPDGSKIAVGVSKCTNCDINRYDGSIVVLHATSGEILWATERLPYGYLYCID